MYILDLSENYFTNFPEEIIQFWSLESLNLHHNTIRSIPNTISSLQCLVNLDLRFVIYIENKYALSKCLLF